MRLASYNVENLFNRAKVMNLDGWENGKITLEKFSKLNQILGELHYSGSAKIEIARLLTELGLAESDQSEYVILRQNRSRLVKRPQTGGIQVIADGRGDWIGSLELIEDSVDEDAMKNTARVMIDLKADVLAVVEAESRPALRDFNEEIIRGLGENPFKHVMLIDGNDSRGIDVGIVTANGYPIDTMRSHVDDQTDAGQLIFSRDCPEFHITTPSGNKLVVLVNHFKSKGYGTQSDSDTKRKLQAEKVRDIYTTLLDSGEKYIAIVGDLNDTPDSSPLEPLIIGTNLQDAFIHPDFDNGGFPGTYGLCNESNKIDYLLLSPDLFNKVLKGGVLRTGMWPGSNPARWPVYTNLIDKKQAGSDHAAVWIDLDL